MSTMAAKQAESEYIPCAGCRSHDPARPAAFSCLIGHSPELRPGVMNQPTVMARCGEKMMAEKPPAPIVRPESEFELERVAGIEREAAAVLENARHRAQRNHEIKRLAATVIEKLEIQERLVAAMEKRELAEIALGLTGGARLDKHAPIVGMREALERERAKLDTLRQKFAALRLVDEGE